MQTKLLNFQLLTPSTRPRLACPPPCTVSETCPCAPRNVQVFNAQPRTHEPDGDSGRSTLEIHVVQCRSKIHWLHTKISNNPSMPAPAKRLQLQAWTLQKCDRTPCSCGPYTISKQSAGPLKAPETFQNSQHAWGA